ncbi:SDR family oxidoreductase [Sphingobium sp. Sx8-8]|uniref:SDR family oxidoreductase n=1 Tax=Sphingobium sp. Sx8-8 TaxID=2933617 RepID=UPI001F575D98|nr:SDR family oxidoreductase [Sphingobium sp. Sx8-8]
MDIAGLFDIKGKRALVTGGSGGIGYMIAEGLVRAGAEVLICSRKAAAVDAAVSALSPIGAISGFAADLTTEEGIAAAAKAVGSDNVLHILINNAGTSWGAPIDSFPRKGLEKVLDLNIAAPFLLTQALLPALRRAATPDDPARIVNIASIDGFRIPPWESYPYSASKAAIIHMGRHMGKFLAGDHISVNAIAPGLFPSKMTAGVFDFDDPEELERAASPLGHRIGTPEDIAGGVIYLCSRAGAWISGATIPIAGGVATID